MHSSLSCSQKPSKPIQAKKRMNPVGKQTRRYTAFRNNVAYPALVERDSERCAMCGKTNIPLDVDHIKKRGSHPELKYELTNLQLLCRSCHNAKDNS